MNTSIWKSRQINKTQELKNYFDCGKELWIERLIWLLLGMTVVAAIDRIAYLYF